MTNTFQPETDQSDTDWSALWDQELGRRLRGLDEGYAKLIPADDVLRAAWLRLCGQAALVDLRR